jgi:hypothetical protein
MWVTVDAAVSNDLFYFEHQPLRLDAMKACCCPTAPKGEVKNKATGRYRTTFDVHRHAERHLASIASRVDGVMGSVQPQWREKRLPRGTTTANLAAADPRRRDRREDRRVQQPQRDLRDRRRADDDRVQADGQGHRAGSGHAPQRPRSRARPRPSSSCSTASPLRACP